MLNKIVKINNVGCFSKYSAVGDVSFRKVTLVYAENGRGKTTFCAVLRSLQSGLAEFISERKTLSTTEPACVHLRLNNNNLQYDNNVWNYIHPDIVIFDPVFINENVYSGDYVEHEHKKNLYHVIVGKRGVELAKEIDRLDQKSRDANTVLRAKKESLTKIVPSGVKLEDYLKWEPIIDIEDQLQQKSVELSKRLLLVEKSKEIQEKGLFLEVKLPTVPPDFVELLKKQLADIADDAELKVQQQIAQHDMGHQGESWLSQGLGYVKNDRCPFCGQDIQSNDLIASYRSHFNESYRNLKYEVSQLIERINSTLGESFLFAVQQLFSNNLALTEFWSQFIEVKLPDISFTDIKQKFTTIREYCIDLAKRKQDNPTEAIIPHPEFFTAISDIEALRKTIEEYNQTVYNFNTNVKEQKAASQKEGEITTLKNEIILLESKKRRFEIESVKICNAYQDAQNNKVQLDERKEKARQQLDQYCHDLIRTYEQSINNYLDQFNAGFRIINTRHLYTGGTPSSQYQIEINNTAVDLGDSRTKPGTPCFKTTLSSGDRSALALAFFLAMLKQDSDLARKIIIFDDPFTSLDRFRRTCTQQLIQQFSESAQQVVVLSHDPFFLKLLWDGCSSTSANVKTLQMAKKSNTTVICEWDIEEEVQSTYIKDFSILLNYYRERRGEPRMVTRAIRPFLEGMLRNHFPGHFLQGEWLGNFIQKIREAGSDSGLQHAKADLDELTAINDYSKKYHHDQNLNADLEPINEDELHGYVKRTLKLVGGC
jgi:wobble nucleotide-excising tRNase